jgi:hypothetical protein
MRSTFIVPAICLLFAAQLQADPIPEPYQWAGLSIRAQGGATNIEKYRGEYIKFQGKMFRESQETAVTGECLLQLPGQFKQIIRFEADGKVHETIAVFDTTKGWRQRDGSTENMNGSEIIQSKDRLHSFNMARLTPLFRDRAFEPAMLDKTASPATIEGMRARGIKVACKGEKDVVLWIDEQKNLVVKIERALQVDDRKVAKMEEFFSEYKEIGGVLRPMRRTSSIDGKKAIDLTIVDIKLYEQIDSKMFEKP